MAARGVSGAVGPAARVFDLARVAEEELAAAGRSGPFLPLCPPAGMLRLDDRVYRAHARELIRRAAAGESLEPGTGAEVLVALHCASLRSPLRHDAAEVFRRLFEGIFEGQAAAPGWEWLAEPAAAPTEHGSFGEAEAEMRRACLVPGRGRRT